MSSIVPPTPNASRRMARVRQKGTVAEVAVRKELYGRGLRYRIDFTVLKKPRRVADIAFPNLRIAVFVDGCFWHGCPTHASWPKHNAEFWRQKIETNRLRDADTDARLLSIGWRVLRFWEHESPVDIAEAIRRMVAMVKSARNESNIEN